MTEATARDEAEGSIVAAVKQLREMLLEAGFRHANAAGELVSKDNTTWIATTYTHGEYSIYAWRRPLGRGELGEVRYVMRATPAVDPKRIDELARRLRRWANKPRKGAVWPPEGLGALR